MDEVKIRDIRVKTVLTKSNLPIAGYSVNPYVGCTHACKYCYACFMKRFTGHDEPCKALGADQKPAEVRRADDDRRLGHGRL